MDLEYLVLDEWYNPDITKPELGIEPFDLAANRATYRAMMGHPQSVEWPLSVTASKVLAESPWLHAYGRPMFDARARRLIDDVAWEGEVRWLPLEIHTPAGVVLDYHIAAPPLDFPDVLSEPHTTRDPIGRPIRWVLDRDKLGSRQVLMFPGVSVGGLLMRGRLLQQLLDLGAKGVIVERARVVPSA